MQESFFSSSDSVRHARPLKHARKVSFDRPLELESGGRLEKVDVVYETYGALNARRDNAVLICHAISGDSHVAAHDEADDPGWWDVVVGPGRSIDTDRYFVICANCLGGCRGTTGPNSIDPATGRTYGPDFPLITVGDMVRVQTWLVEHLGIDRLVAVVGGSMGGHQALLWGTRWSDRVRGVVGIATSARLTSQALAFDVVGRNAIMQDPNFADGQYYGRSSGPTVGLAIARMIGHITYLSREAMGQKFEADRLRPRDVDTGFENLFSVGSYLGYKGGKFVEIFDANSYITLSLAMDFFDLGGAQERLREAVRLSSSRWLLISFTGDWLFPPEQSQELVDALVAQDKPVSYCNVRSSCGHDAFLLPADLDPYGGLVSAFLENLRGTAARRSEEQWEHAWPSPVSIFQKRRLDYDRIIQLIPEGTSVLDLGCGRGGLLARLRERGYGRLVGVELDEAAILSCVRQGLDVLHGDLNEGLGRFGDHQFDVVVLSQTLQAIRDVERILSDMLRVGRRCVVSFPNVGCERFRRVLTEQGRAPLTSRHLGYQWYNTPEIRFLSIADFEDYCRQRDIRIEQSLAIDTEAGQEVTRDANRQADLAIFVITR